MGAHGKKTAPAEPTRRKVLVTALAAGAGVASARILGLRNLDASESLSAAMTAMDMSMATAMVQPADEYDAMFGVPDDSYLGPQDQGPSNVPQSSSDAARRRRRTAAPTTARPHRCSSSATR